MREFLSALFKSGHDSDEPRSQSGMADTTFNESSSDETIIKKWLTGPWAMSLLVAVVLVITFYVEEDWRGAVEWNKAQAEIAAAGESLDPSKFIPPPIPEDRNFGAMPIFQLSSDPSSDYPHNKVAAGMKRAFRHAPIDKLPYSKDYAKQPGELPYLGIWAKGEAPDVEAITKSLIARCHDEIPHVAVPPQAKPAEIFDLLIPDLARLRKANASLPYCRFDEDYTSQPPMLRSYAGVTSPIGFAKVLSYQERLAFMGKDPQLAMDDLGIGWKVDSGIRQEPSLIAGLVSAGVVAIQLAVVSQGLAEHQWNDQQLTDLDDDLEKIDCLRDGQFFVRGELAVQLIPTVDFSETHRLAMRLIIFGGRMSSGSDIYSTISSTLMLLIPKGWFLEFKADDTRFQLLGAVKMMDPASHRVFPEREAKALALIQGVRGTGYWRDFLEGMFSSSLSAAKNFAYTQARVDEARIACRLERYRLAHGRYPDSLSELVPVYGADLPRDVMSGQSYGYRLLDDRSYLLYSVAWNQKDDGGTSFHSTSQAPKDAPDWVWDNHPETLKTK